MQWLRNNLPLAIAAALSVSVHLFVLFPALGIFRGGEAEDGIEHSSLETPIPDPALGENAEQSDDEKSLNDDAQKFQKRADNARRALQERRERDRELPPELREQPQEDDVRLGIDQSAAVTMNWIGYEQYEQHLAELAEIEQAAYRLQLASGSRGTEASTLPPAEPSPTVAMSPNPSALPLPASAVGPSVPTPSNLVMVPAIEPTTTLPAAPPTESALTRGADAESARPLPPPEAATAAAIPDSSVPPGDAPESAIGDEPAGAAADPSDEPRAEPTTDAPQPPLPSPFPPNAPDDGTEPVPPVKDPTKTDPLNEPREDPTEVPDPSAVDPAKPLDPSPSGVEPNAPPRDPADPTRESPKPPVDAPKPNDEPNPEVPPAENPAVSNPADSTVSNAANAPNATGMQGGGIAGPQPVDGIQNTPTAPSPAGAPGDTTSPSGELSDRESDPTSTIDVEMVHWKNGKPLASEGITLKPARPRFTTLNYVDGVGRNPIGELVFGRDGVPQLARIIRSTGNAGVDEAIRAALFKWRASGKKLEKLKPGQKLTIRLRIIMLAD